MAVSSYPGWVADGKPAYEAQPIADMFNYFKSKGFTVYWYPNQAHLTATPPEDHTPFSHTPWPGAQPYPLCLALDLMPKDGDARSLTKLARQIIADKRSGVAPWIKYMNWTDENNKCWHTKWQPNEVTTASTDRDHIHISIRTDWADPAQAQAAGHNIYAAKNWDPFAEMAGVPPTQGDEDMGGIKVVIGRDDTTGKEYLCNGVWSRWVPDATAMERIHALAAEGVYDLVTGPAGSPFWIDEGKTRTGWEPSTFGQEWTPSTFTDEQITQLANDLAPLLKTGATVDDVKAIINATKLSTP